MKSGISDMINVEKYRKHVQTFINLHAYQAALFWADKVAALTGSPQDIYWLAQCMFLLKQYHRAAHLVKSRGLHTMFILCNYLTVKCLLEANEIEEALKVMDAIDFDIVLHNGVNASLFFDDTPCNQILSAVLLLKGKVLENMDNRTLAADCYRQALQYDVHCYEAFDALIKYQMLSAAEERELLNKLPVHEQCLPEEAEMILNLYGSKLKKYHTPSTTKIIESNISEIPCENSLNIVSNIISNSIQSLPTTPNIIAPSSISTPRPNEHLQNSEHNRADEKNLYSISKLKDSLDLHVAEAERLYYNCDYQQCSELTESILKRDPYHSDCLPIYISCQVELKQSNKLFSLAHNLVAVYPCWAISWFAVGCYYYIIGKSDYARRYLTKATCLDRLFGPAWLAYGHSFAIESEHDQAMAAYFKACQLMKGCHLPLLYIGLESGLTNNVQLGDKFFKQALSIAPEDPFVIHEMGVIAFQNANYKLAEKHFREALEKVKSIKPGLIPKRWEALLNNLGHTCRKLKKYEEALDFHNQALLLSPQSASTYSVIAYNHALMGHTEEAVDWFHKALGLRNDDSFCTTMLNYVIEQLTEEKPAYIGAPDYIPKFYVESRSIEETTEGNVTPGTSENLTGCGGDTTEMSMCMSIEVDMSDASGMTRE